MLQSEHNRQLREIDQQFENLKRSIPEHVLKMKIKDLACFRGFDEILVKEKMCDFNCTVKETVQKAGDEGKLNFIIFFGAFGLILDLHFPHLLT